MIDEITDLLKCNEAQLLEPIEEGKWSIKEIVGHLYYWNKFNLEVMVPNMKEGESLPIFPDHDRHKNEAIISLENESVQSVFEKFIETRKKLIEEISSISNEIRFTIGKGKRQISTESFIKMFVKHDEHHLAQINVKMNFTINRDVFYEAVVDVSRAISHRTPRFILTGIKIVAVENSIVLIASNNEVTIEKAIPSIVDNEQALDVKKAGSVVIPSKYLLELVKRLPEKITINVSNDNTVQMSSKGITSNIKGFNPKYFPENPKMTEGPR